MNTTKSHRDRIRAERKNSDALGYFLCIPTMRLRDAAETVRQFDANFTHYGHKIPIIIFSDADPDSRNSKGELRFPNYDDDFAFLQEAAKQCTNDVYIVTREDKEQFKAMLRREAGDFVESRFHDAEGAILGAGDAFDLMLEGGAGGNKNYTLLYTHGSYVMQMDDDIRPYEISTQNSNTEYLTSGKETWSLAMRDHPKEISTYETLKDFSPLDDANRIAANGSRKILVMDSDKNPLSKDVQYCTFDTASAFFSVLGLSARELNNQFSKQGRSTLLKGDIFTMSDVDWRTNNTIGTLQSFFSFLPLLFKSKFPLTQNAVRDFYLFPGSKRGELQNLEEKNVLPAKDRNPVVRFVNSGLTGTFDDDPTSFVGNEFPQVGVLKAHGLQPAVANACLSIFSGVLGIDNREGVGPNVKNYRIDDWGYRYQSLASDTLTMQLPFALTHIRSPQRASGMRNYYDEMIGGVIKVLLLEGRADDGTYANLSEQYTPEMAHQLLINSVAYGRMALTAQSSDSYSVFQNELRKGDLKAFYTGTAAEIHSEIELFRLMNDVWPKLYEVVKRHRHELPLHDLKTGEKTCMADITEKEFRKEKGYTDSFTFHYPQNDVTAGLSSQAKIAR